MTDPALKFASSDRPSLPLRLVPADGLDAALDALEPRARRWVTETGFAGRLGELALIPDAQGAPALALFGWGDEQARERGRFHLAGARDKLPGGTWHLESDLGGDDLDEAALGWLLAGYRFSRYKQSEPPAAGLKAPAGVNAARLETIAAAEALTRDLINTPANDMGPEDLERAARDLAAAHGAEIAVTEGEALLGANLPLIHAVGRAAAQAPRLIELRWGDAGPRVALVGKGVCFDTGGLNLKPGTSMGLMKKDMGGAATVLGLARMIMALGLAVRLRVLIPAVENAVSAGAMRPGDILRSRKGLSVEVNNTDAEGRLVLADALALADEETPDLLISMATLTGAARVALGPDLPPFYSRRNSLARAIGEGARQARDPLWRMPLWAPYEEMLEPAVADLDNAPGGGLAGSVTAALFLHRFVTETRDYAHFDIYGWQPRPAPARPKGGVGQGARAILAALPAILGL